MVLEKLTIFRQAANKRCNIFIKLPADIDEIALGTVISLAYIYSIEGFIATGPTMDRSGLHQAETKQLEKIGNGGVSGRGIGKEIAGSSALFIRTYRSALSDYRSRRNHDSRRCSRNDFSRG